MFRCPVVRAVLPTGVQVTRPLTTTEIAANDLRSKFSKIGAADHSKVTVRDLFAVWKTANSYADYSASLHVLNVCYNFGLKLDHYELPTRLLAVCLACRKEDEAVQLIEHYDCFLGNPPSSSVIFSLMGTLLTKGLTEEKYLWDCRKVLQLQREKWQIPLTPAMYVLGIEAMVRIDVMEALVLLDDAALMQVRLPLPTLALILEKVLETNPQHERVSELVSLIERRRPWRSQGLRLAMLVAWSRIGTPKWDVELLEALQNAHLRNYALNGMQIPKGFISALDPEHSHVLEACKGNLGRFII